MNADQFFAQQWLSYTEVTPLAKRVHQLFQDKGETVSNDHIALRTLAHPSIGLEAFAAFFAEMGYVTGGEYFFEQKRLRAIHMSAPDLPRVFISELLYEDEKFSDFLERTMEGLVTTCDAADLEQLFQQQRPWQPSYACYERLAQESEYSAWMYAWGFRVNHFTVSVNHLQQFPDIASVNTFLKEHHFKLNQSGGEVKGVTAQGLVQSSTLADLAAVNFIEGEQKIPSCYYEFAKRYEIAGELYQGFVPSSADKIFESTDRVQHD